MWRGEPNQVAGYNDYARDVLHCPDGSPLSRFDDPQHLFPGLIDFLTSLRQS